MSSTTEVDDFHLDRDHDLPPVETTGVHAPAAETVTTATHAAPVMPPPTRFRHPLGCAAISLEGLPDAPVELAYVIVIEAGASDYSASPVAREEFPRPRCHHSRNDQYR